MPSTRVATTGTPMAMASRTVRGVPSEREVMSSTSTAGI